MSKKVTQEEFEKRVYDKYSDEYKVVGKYVSGHIPIKIKHKCGWEYDVDPYSFLGGHAKCPLCYKSSKSIDTSAFKQKVKNMFGDEYSVLSEYLGANKPITVKHNKCSCEDGYYIWETTPHSFVYNGHLCPYESHLYLDIDEIKKRLSKHHPNYTCLSEKYEPGKPIKVVCDKEHVYEVSLSNLSAGTGCPYCTNQRVLIGYNDLQTTHPHIAHHLANKDDGYKYMYGSKHKLDFVCPDCGTIIQKFPALLLSESGKVVCKCNDGISYPEKFFTSFLQQLGINYETQLSKSTFDWCDKYRYDFYLSDYNIICEIHGMQHYKDCSWFNSVEEVRRNDKDKYDNAICHVDHYIVIDARYSLPDYIKNSICNSLISEYFDLSIIDWGKCNLDANTSLIIKAAELWNSGMHDASQISEQLKIVNGTTLNYLESAAYSGLCDFNREQYRKDVNHGSKRIRVKCIETNTEYQSLADAFQNTGIRLSKKAINNKSTIGGFHWEIIE